MHFLWLFDMSIGCNSNLFTKRRKQAKSLTEKLIQSSDITVLTNPQITLLWIKLLQKE